MEHHSLTHFPSQPWCKMCVESRGHDSPHREQSKIDAVVPQLQFDYGYTWVTEALCRSRASLWEQTRLLEPSTRRWCRTPRRWTCPTLSQQQPSGCVTWCIHSTQKINDMSYDQLISDPSTYVKKRAQRSDDSILLRHMDDVVGTGPEEHLMSDFAHMKTSLYLTDAVVLRHEGDTVNLLGLEITKTRKGFEVKNSTDLVESLLNLYRLPNSKPTVNPGRRSTVMELASATPLGGHDHSNFRTAVGKLIFMAPWRPDVQFAIQQLSTQVLNHDRKQARSEAVDTISQRQATHSSSSSVARNGSNRFAGTRWSQ